MEIIGKYGHSETSKSGSRIKIICFSIFLKNKNCVKKISSKNGTLYKFFIKIYLKSFVFSYHFCCYHFCFIIFIWNHLQKYFLFTTWTSLWISDSLTAWHIIFSFFLLTAIFEGTSCVFVPKCFTCSDSFVYTPSHFAPSLCWTW